VAQAEHRIALPDGHSLEVTSMRRALAERARK
jgi:hypothetical protein